MRVLVIFLSLFLLASNALATGRAPGVGAGAPGPGVAPGNPAAKAAVVDSATTTPAEAANANVAVDKGVPGPRVAPARPAARATVRH